MVVVCKRVIVIVIGVPGDATPDGSIVDDHSRL
jgi:hypothetical protein